MTSQFLLYPHHYFRHMIGIAPYDSETLARSVEAQRQARLGTRISGKRLNSAAAMAPAAPPRTVRDVAELDLSRMSAMQLPDVVRETIAEHIRRRGWQRVFPCPEEPDRYLDLFEVPRAPNVLVARAAAEAASRVLTSERHSS